MSTRNTQNAFRLAPPPKIAGFVVPSIHTQIRYNKVIASSLCDASAGCRCALYITCMVVRCFGNAVAFRSGASRNGLSMCPHHHHHHAGTSAAGVAACVSPIIRMRVDARFRATLAHTHAHALWM